MTYAAWPSTAPRHTLSRHTLRCRTPPQNRSPFISSSDCRSKYSSPTHLPEIKDQTYWIEGNYNLENMDQFLTTLDVVLVTAKLTSMRELPLTACSAETILQQLQKGSDLCRDRQ